VSPGKCGKGMELRFPGVSGCFVPDFVGNPADLRSDSLRGVRRDESGPVLLRPAFGRNLADLRTAGLIGESAVELAAYYVERPGGLVPRVLESVRPRVGAGGILEIHLAHRLIFAIDEFSGIDVHRAGR